MRAFGITLTMLLGVGSAHAQAVADRLSFFEEARSREIGGATVSLQSLVDAGLRIGEKGRTEGPLFRTRSLATVERQFDNAVTGFAFGELRTSFGVDVDDKRIYNRETDWTGGAGVSGVWGKVSGGRVTQAVEFLTDRRPGVGNASLRDERTGVEIDQLGGAYELRMGHARFGVAVDRHGRFDVGVVAQRPLGAVDRRFTLRITDGRFVVGKDDHGRAQAVAVGAGTTYGPVFADVEAGAERLRGPILRADRPFVEAGIGMKRGPWAFSAEGRYARTNRTREMAWALGARLDLARGLSVNFGYNGTLTDGTIRGVALARKKREALFSMRYEY